MARCKQTLRKKSPAKKLIGSEQVTLSSHDIMKKPAIRHSFESAPNLGDDIHLIWVNGPSEYAKLFTIHSALFPNATLEILSKSLTQPAQSIPIDFHTVEVLHETFEIYRQYLYTEKRKLFSHDPIGDQDYADDGDSDAHKDREWVRLANAYFLGLKLRDEKFCNTVVDGLVEKMAQTDRYPTGLASDVYAQTSHGDKLRALLVDLHVWKGEGTWINAPHDDANGPVYFRRDVRRGVRKAGAALEDRDLAMPWKVDLCQYHIHETTGACEREVTAEVEGSETQSESGSENESTALLANVKVRRSARAVARSDAKVCKSQAFRRR